jgi:hypothetical protein
VTANTWSRRRRETEEFIPRPRHASRQERLSPEESVEAVKEMFGG